MLALVSLAVSIFATLIGKLVLYGDFPAALRPSRFSMVVLAAGFCFYLYCIVCALVAFFDR